MIYTDALHRLAYATDASIYREIPLGVAYPHNEQDLQDLLLEARRRHTYLIPRAGGTSIAGQVVGSGIVVDVSRYMNKILEINVNQRWARVQPGVVRDELNLALRQYGLFFSPETSTSNRCCIGGMVGNNSCGTHSLIYGSTRHHVIGLRIMLADGSVHEISCKQPLQSTIQDSLSTKIMSQLIQWQHDMKIRQLLRDSFPDISLRRRSCGYALDECLADEIINLPALLTGSEGTLALVTEITLSLDPLPPKQSMVVCAHLDAMHKAWPANLIALQYHPAAVELLDGKILELAKSNIEANKNRFFVVGEPAGIVIVEIQADSREQLEKQATELIHSLSSFSYACTCVYNQDVQRVWALRKAGLGVLGTMSGDAKPIGVIEDTAIPPERLEVFMRDFGQMMEHLSLDCVYYGHISTGELHLRPILDVRQSRDRKLFRQVATEMARLVRIHHGSLSGEHGDGRLRGEFIPMVYGEEVYHLFCQLKTTFDPDGLLNMGKIVDTPPMDAMLRVELHQPTTDLLRRIERCNGAGDCRKSNLIGGTMCPAYKASGDELTTTRARANVLREYLTARVFPSRSTISISYKQIQQIVYSCLACKGCRSECPSNVDMTRIRSEVLQTEYDLHHTPFRTWMVAHMACIERIGSCVPRIYNWFATTRWTSCILKYLLRFSSQRAIPTLSRMTLRQLVRTEKPKHPKNGRRVYLFADEFTSYQEAELGITFVRFLQRLGYEVIIPQHVESGRAAISKGCLHLAAKYAHRNVDLLKNLITEKTPLVGIEPSCILSFRDEYPYLIKSHPSFGKSTSSEAIALAKNCLLYDEFILREIQAGYINPKCFHALSDNHLTIYLHGHCHQKALVGVEKTAECLCFIPNASVHVIPSGCCGMAGSFGYEKEHYQTSMQIGEMVLFPAVRNAEKDAIVCAPGTSCRQQILDGTGRQAYHPIEILYQSLSN